MGRPSVGITSVVEANSGLAVRSSRLGGGRTAGRERYLTRAAERQLLLVERIRRLIAELERRDRLIATQPSRHRDI